MVGPEVKATQALFDVAERAARKCPKERQTKARGPKTTGFPARGGNPNGYCSIEI
jgi:hypothetical protein